MPTKTKRAVPAITISGGEVKEIDLQKGMLEEGLSIVHEGSVSAADGTAYNRAAHLTLVELLADTNRVLCYAKPADLMVEAELLDRHKYTDIMSYRSGTTFRDVTPLMFRQMWAFERLAELTCLPTWLMQHLKLRVTCGTRATVAASGTGTITNSTVTVVQNGIADPVRPGKFADNASWGRNFGRTVRTYQEVAISGAGEMTAIELPDTADIRSLLLRTVNSSSVESDSIISNVRLILNNAVRQYETTYNQLRSENARVYGVTPPTGYVLVDAAEDKDTLDIFPATKLGAFHLQCTALAAGTLRIMYNMIAPE